MSESRFAAILLRGNLKMTSTQPWPPYAGGRRPMRKRVISVGFYGGITPDTSSTFLPPVGTYPSTFGGKRMCQFYWNECYEFYTSPFSTGP